MARQLIQEMQAAEATRDFHIKQQSKVIDELRADILMAEKELLDQKYRLVLYERALAKMEICE